MNKTIAELEKENPKPDYSWGVGLKGRGLMTKGSNNDIFFCSFECGILCADYLEELDAREFADKHGMDQAMKIRWMRIALLVRVASRALDKVGAIKAKREKIKHLEYAV